MNLNQLPKRVVDELFAHPHHNAAIHFHSLLAQAWAEGYQDACDDTPMDFAPVGPTDERNPYVRQETTR